MSWHYFQPGTRYELSEVVDACERRMNEGGVKDIEGKRKLVAMMNTLATSVIVWSPFGDGWGASPFNPNCWKTISGEKIFPDDVVPDLVDDDVV